MFERTKDVMTAGITNIPLTKPAFLYFISPIANEDRIEQIHNVFTLARIPYRREDNIYTENAYLISEHEVSVDYIKAIWRNFKSLKPKLKSAWRYLFWELDTQIQPALEEVTAVYNFFNLPIYIHKTMRGYHFLSVKPIEEYSWNLAISRLRRTNPDYPPTTLRIQANKYVGEEAIFKDGYTIMGKGESKKKHYDTERLMRCIETFNLHQLQQDYIIVFYPFPDQAKLDSMTVAERTQFQLKQIEDSE